MFQYMLLLRGATEYLQQWDDWLGVSIHAPLARSNLNVDAIADTVYKFQYMLLLRGATWTLASL